MALSELAFVLAPAASPTTVISLTTPVATNVMVEEFDLGAPEFEGAAGSIGAEYGERSVSFKVVVSGGYTVAGPAMQAIVRQLLAEKNWLMVQWAGSNTRMFLRTYRTGQAALEWENSGVGIWELPVSLICDPFLYGVPQTIGPVTIKNDPAAATGNPAWYKFGTILGDAPTGLKVTVVPSSPYDEYSCLMATAAFDAAENPTGPTVWQAEAFPVLGADTTVVAAALYSGGSYLQTTFATDNNLTLRMRGAPSSQTTPGTYKVLCRFARSDLSSTFALRMGQQSGTAITSFAYGDTVTMNRNAQVSGAYATWIDLGDFTLPIGSGGIDLADIGNPVYSLISLQIQRLTGAGNARIDAFLLIPIDTATTYDTAVCRTTFYGPGITTDITGVWDGARTPPQFRAYGSGGWLSTLTPPRIDGRFLRVTPGLTNVFQMVEQTKTDSPSTVTLNGDVLADTASVTFSYYPKYLHARPEGL